ncbi:hypothetical protein [Streptomyces sp. MMG1533]|uniref:hypothetical protein n=1 Tax=Streptomyces sp. MMG1533 TaxID=1415546 RepID=UPI0006AEDFBF|nr:hypothetical protein [Streptomyces sp. MMG1533]
MTIHDVARRLPDIPALRDHCRSMAMLEAILSPEWGDRHHSFDARWSDGEEMASMRNGSGDEFAVVFSAAGAYVRGFAHESPTSPYTDDGPWPGVVDEVPEVFRSYVEEPAFTDEDGMPVVTACAWRETGDGTWRTGAIEFPGGDGSGGDPDGSGYLFRLLVDRSPEAFRDFAEDQYEVPVSLAAVRHVFALRPLTGEVVAALNPETSVDALSTDIAGIGYPTGNGAHG